MLVAGFAQVSVQVDPGTELITGFNIAPEAPAASPVAVALPAGLTDTEVSFTSGDDTIYGSESGYGYGYGYGYGSGYGYGQDADESSEDDEMVVPTRAA